MKAHIYDRTVTIQMIRYFLEAKYMKKSRKDAKWQEETCHKGFIEMEQLSGIPKIV